MIQVSKRETKLAQFSVAYAVAKPQIGLLLTQVPRAKNWVPRFAEPSTVNVILMGLIF